LFSVMIQKMDKKALAMRLFGKEMEDSIHEEKEEEKIIETEEV